jgi:hypothetical protein
VDLDLGWECVCERLVTRCPPALDLSRASYDDGTVAELREPANEPNRPLHAAAADRWKVIGEEQDRFHGNELKQIRQ